MIALRNLKESLDQLARNSAVIASHDYEDHRTVRAARYGGQAEAYRDISGIVERELERVAAGSWMVELQPYRRGRFHAQIERWPTEVQAQHQLAGLNAQRSVRYFHASRIRHVDELATHGLQVRSDHTEA